MQWIKNLTDSVRGKPNVSVGESESKAQPSADVATKPVHYESFMQINLNGTKVQGWVFKTQIYESKDSVRPYRKFLTWWHKGTSPTFTFESAKDGLASRHCVRRDLIESWSIELRKVPT